MKQPFLTINDNENLEISDMDTDSVPVEFDINADFDGSFASLQTLCLTTTSLL